MSDRALIVDVGSTTTKALLFACVDGRWRLVQRGDASTTVEAPYADVNFGVNTAIERLWAALPSHETDAGQEALPTAQLLATSSAGGGLQMVVCGNVSSITLESAQRAALGGGAVLLDAFAADDGRTLFTRMERLRQLRPDMVLVSGGVEGAQMINCVLEMCDLVRMSYASSRSKFGYEYRVPVIYAGNSAATPVVEDLLSGDFDLSLVPNLRPDFYEENLDPTRAAIHELFITHVMAHAPGYQDLQERMSSPVLPTPVAVGEILQRYASKTTQNVICVDIGGATTDLFSVIDGRYHRTVSANYGMSYSAGNVMAAAGIEQIARWVPFDTPNAALAHSIGNKMLYPTTVPVTVEDLLIEQALAREAIRMALSDHKNLAHTHGHRPRFGESPIRLQEEIVKMQNIDLIIGSGGVISHAPLRGQAMAMLIDAMEPEGVTALAVDSVFMLPHLGALARHDPDAALELLTSECLIPLGVCIAPVGTVGAGEAGCRVSGETTSGRQIDRSADAGSLEVIPLAAGEEVELLIRPSFPLNVGHGPGIPRRCRVAGGEVGIVIDLRGRPLSAHSRADNRRWLKALQAWPCAEEVGV